MKRLNYIILQAGGKGTRLGYLTKNKPKALVSVENLPMLFHLFRKYPDARFVIIADYKDDALQEYLRAFADVKYLIVKASGTGTCAGMRQSLELIPDGEPFMLIWSDLILPDGFELPREYQDSHISSSSALQERNGECVCGQRDIRKPLWGEEGCGYERYGQTLDAQGRVRDQGGMTDYLGLSTNFPCRWKYEDGKFSEESSTEFGVAGFFLFHDKSALSDVPESGELVRWMQEKNLTFSTISLAGTREFGLLKEYEKLSTIKTRPFNRIRIDGNVLTKEPVDGQGRGLAVRERAWYEKAKDLNITGIPKVYHTSPLKMEYIKGRNIYECNFEYAMKLKILESLVDTLKDLHGSSSIPSDAFSIKEAYFNKTMQRLSKIEYLVPFAREEFIIVNGRKCRNVFYCRNELEKALDGLRCDSFPFIHGDCTFSNLMVRDTGGAEGIGGSGDKSENGDEYRGGAGEPVLIDPRGYFGFTELYGDERYDWAKLYYSIVGNYDKFNLKKFSLDIGGHSVVDGEIIKDLKPGEIRLSIESNDWEDMEDDFFRLTGTDEYEIKLLHAVIWLSLTTYAWQDYDSICGAFYNGLYYLEEVL